MCWVQFFTEVFESRANTTSNTQSNVHNAQLLRISTGCCTGAFWYKSFDCNCTCVNHGAVLRSFHGWMKTFLSYVLLLSMQSAFKLLMRFCVCPFIYLIVNTLVSEFFRRIPKFICRASLHQIEIQSWQQVLQQQSELDKWIYIQVLDWLELTGVWYYFNNY